MVKYDQNYKIILAIYIDFQLTIVKHQHEICYVHVYTCDVLRKYGHMGLLASSGP